MGRRELSVDIVDRAQDREAAFVADTLESQQRAAALDAPGAEICADCHEQIPLERRQALPSAIRCVNCQAWAERVAKIRNAA